MYVAYVKAIINVNESLNKLIQAVPLADVRYPRIRDLDGCGRADCGGRDMIEEFLKPCYDLQARYVPEPDVSLQPTRRMNDLVAQGVHLIIFVSFAMKPGDPFYGFCQNRRSMIAFTRACAFDGQTIRPTHGRVTFCESPLDYTTDVLSNVLLHEILHILIPVLSNYITPGLRVSSFNDLRAQSKDLEDILEEGRLYVLYYLLFF